MFVYHCIWSLGHATDYLFPDCQSFPLANSFSPRFSKFPTSSIHVLLLYLDLAISYTNNSVSRQSLTRQRLAAIVNELIWQSICLGTCFCQVIVLAIWNFFALKTRNPSNSSNSCYPTMQTSKQKVPWITWPLRNPINRTPCIKELCALQPI